MDSIAIGPPGDLDSVDETGPAVHRPSIISTMIIVTGILSDEQVLVFIVVVTYTIYSAGSLRAFENLICVNGKRID